MTAEMSWRRPNNMCFCVEGLKLLLNARFLVFRVFCMTLRPLICPIHQSFPTAASHSDIYVQTVSYSLIQWLVYDVVFSRGGSHAVATKIDVADTQATPTRPRHPAMLHSLSHKFEVHPSHNDTSLNKVFFP